MGNIIFGSINDDIILKEEEIHEDIHEDNNNNNNNKTFASVIEYSEISKKDAEALQPDNNKRLKFSAAHICVNYFSFNFLEKAASASYQSCMWHHIAKKDIPSIGGLKVKGWKLEQYIFDMFSNAEKLVVFQVPRNEEFAPIKNADGKSLNDTPTTASNLLSNLHKSYVIKNGGKFSNDNNNNDNNLCCEISPFLSLNGENLENKVKDKVFTLPIYIQ